MKICIDPGHGGSDPGATGPTGLREKDINLNIATNIGQILRRHGISTILTRQNDSRVELADRVKMANNDRVDYFISIHANSASNPAATGTETFAFPNSDTGIKLASVIQRSLVNEINLADRGVKHKDFFVLKNTEMPAVLVEVAFINNPKEEKLLRDQNFLDKAAIGISEGILMFLEVEHKEGIYIDSTVSSWAKDAMEWATDKVINLTDGSMSKESVNLERLITILHRYHNLFGK
ncbi:MAG TPA: N-acetylmuramoyl-L-alanine amidase [Clostridia bacterium]|nr:N-acetylmuramoyl-L-alanine amidase [Clostridia bacterium]